MRGRKFLLIYKTHFHTWGKLEICWEYICNWLLKGDHKLSKEQVRPGERKAKEAEDIELLGKKLEASEPLNTCSATDKFSRHLWCVCLKSLPFPGSCSSVSPIHYSSGSLAVMFMNCNLMATAYWSQVGIWSMLDQLPSLRISKCNKEIPSSAAYIMVGTSAALIPGSSLIWDIPGLPPV